MFLNIPMTKLLALSTLLLHAGTMSARTPSKYEDDTKRIELSLGHGQLPSPQLFANVKSPTRYYHATSSGAAFLALKYQASRNVAVGLIVAYDFEAGLWAHIRQPSDPILSNAAGTFVRHTVTFAPELTIAYYNSPGGLVTIYGVAGAGYQRRMQEITWDYDTNPAQHINDVPPNPAANRMAWQLSPAGVRFGKALSAFAEVGVGYRGVVCYGISYRF